MKNTYVIIGVVATVTLLAVHKGRSCLNHEGSTYDHITCQCATCMQNEAGQWYKVWFSIPNGTSCSNAVYSDKCGQDLSCGRDPVFYLYDLYENVSKWPYSGACQNGSCIGTRGTVIDVEDRYGYGGTDC
jgi:hypothetical protein